MTHTIPPMTESTEHELPNPPFETLSLAGQQGALANIAFHPPLLTWMPVYLMHPAPFVPVGPVQDVQDSTREQSSPNGHAAHALASGVPGTSADFDPSRRMNPTLPLILYPILVLGMLPWMHHSSGGPGPGYGSPPGYGAPFAPPYGYPGTPQTPPPKPHTPWFW